jgi:hypothetical protein
LPQLWVVVEAAAADGIVGMSTAFVYGNQCFEIGSARVQNEGTIIEKRRKEEKRENRDNANDVSKK